MTLKIFRRFFQSQNYRGLFTETQASIFAQIQSKVADYVNASMARFITGDLSIENDWSTCITELGRMGVDRYVSIHQEAFDAKYSK